VLLSKSAVVPLNVRVAPVRLNKLPVFSVTLTNNNAAYFAISGNTLKLAKTVDYQTTKNLSITVRVTDTNSQWL
jgi:mRNA-degrading endonuclease HigB of HigAB toxin-antitoxin module